jgi:hypothetical protein
MGAHARTKLVPAIEANGQTLASVVSRKAVGDLPACPVFPSLDAALQRLPRSAAVFVATPPRTHAELAACAAANGFDVILEKPAFVTVQEATSVRELAQTAGTLVIEAFMHRHTRLHEQFLASLRSKPLRDLSVTFTIDEAPPNTFRDDRDIGSSSLYDIGCYGVDLILDLGLDPDALHIEHVDFPGEPGREQVRIGGASQGVDISICVGLGAAYENLVSCGFAGGERVDAWPFFYGRRSERHLRTSTAEDVSQRSVLEANAFEQMLEAPRVEWLRTAAERWERMLVATHTLERLGQELAGIRRRSDGDRRGASRQKPE